MKLAVLYFDTDIRWSLHKNTPFSIQISDHPTLKLINPLYYFALPSEIQWELRGIRVIGISNGVSFLSVPWLLFNTQKHDLIFSGGNEEVYSVPDDAPVAEVMNDVSNLLSRLRHVSKQFDMPTSAQSVVHIFPLETQESSPPDLVLPDAHVDSYVPKYLLDTAIRWEYLEAYKEEIDVESTFETILLDAIQAFWDKDYRRTILYSAMTIEVTASEALEEEYQAIRTSEPNDAEYLRITEFQQAGGEVTVKDPVYKLLTDRPKFSHLLHEIPLYLLQKSLLLDNEELYQTARKLYRTRNKIVHRGEPPIEKAEKYLEINRQDALVALKTAIHLVSWFGYPDRYFVPSGTEFYKLRTASDIPDVQTTSRP